MGILKALKAANDWHADRLHNGGRVIAHHSLSGTGLSNSHCAGCGKRAKQQVDSGGKKGKKVGFCGSKKCSSKLGGLIKAPKN